MESYLCFDTLISKFKNFIIYLPLLLTLLLFSLFIFFDYSIDTKDVTIQVFWVLLVIAIYFSICFIITTFLSTLLKAKREHLVFFVVAIVMLVILMLACLYQFNFF